MGTVFRQKGRSTWMLKYYRDGRPIYESSGTKVKDEATTLLRKREGAIADGHPVTNKIGRLKCDDAVKDVVNDYTVNQRKSLRDVQARIRLHLTPAFGGRKMSRLTTADIRTYTAERLKAGAKAASINRELAIIKRAFTLAMRAGTLMVKPHVPMLAEHNVRTGFFEHEQFEAVRRHLPTEMRPLVAFAYYAGWRVPSEVAPLTWAQVDEHAEVIRLEVGSTKNAEGRTFPYGVLPELKAVVTAQAGVRDELKGKGMICPYVFPRADGQRIKTALRGLA